jgi:hypothetical protein
MSQILKERETASESLFARSEEEAFMRKAIRDRRLGLWVASLRSLGPDEADRYARIIVALGVSSGDDEELIHTLAWDLAADGIPVAPEEIRRTLRRIEGDVADIGKPEAAGPPTKIGTV